MRGLPVAVAESEVRGLGAAGLLASSAVEAVAMAVARAPAKGSGR